MKSNLDQSKEGITFRLRTKFLIVIILAECLIMSSIILVVERQLRHSILDEFRKRGIAISKHLSSVNANLVTTYNYVSIEQNVARAVNDNGLTYALIQLFDGEVAAYSGEKDIKEDILSLSLIHI